MSFYTVCNAKRILPILVLMLELYSYNEDIPTNLRKLSICTLMKSECSETITMDVQNPNKIDLEELSKTNPQLAEAIKCKLRL